MKRQNGDAGHLERAESICQPPFHHKPHDPMRLGRGIPQSVISGQHNSPYVARGQRDPIFVLQAICLICFHQMFLAVRFEGQTGVDLTL